MFKERQKVPTFNAMDQSGNRISLKDYLGKKLVLYFYVRDSTPGCTLESIEFAKHYKEFKKLHAEIAGICVGTVESHKKFGKNCGVPFKLLVDQDAKIAKKFGVWKLKTFMGRKFMGIERTTFVIDEMRKLIKIFPKVSVTGHAKEVLEFLKSL